MNIHIGRSHISGEIKIISSKSDAHRLFIGAALADATTQIQMEGWSADMEATKNCLEALGAIVARTEQGVTITPIPRGVTGEAFLDCGESGSTLRFLLPIITALGRHAMIEGQGRLPERPIGILLSELEKNGCKIEGASLPIAMEGQLRGGQFTLAGNISSQFITGLLFALPLLKEDSEIILTTKLESVGYVHMTLQTLETFGIHIEETATGYKIKGGQIYHSPKVVMAEGDWSGAAFWLGAGAMKGEVLCTGLRKDSAQGDMEILSLLERFGAEVQWEATGVRVKKSPLQGIDIDATQIPDLVPMLATIGAMAKGRTVITNAGRLRIKESDRLKAMAEGLLRLGVMVIEEAEGLIIHGEERLPVADVVLDGYGDHRIVMALTMAAAALDVEATIEGAEAVAKSYPPFFAEFVRLGGSADVF